MPTEPSLTPPQGFFETDAAMARLRRRKRAEWRLKAYGIAAIALAALALLALLGSVVGKATGALTESYITLPVVLDAQKLDPSGERDPKTLLRADFAGLTKKTLKAYFPYVKGRKDKRALYDLVSGGASFELARKVAQNPELLGKTIDFRFLASDTTDLYLKGAFGSLQPEETRGLLTADVKGKTVVLHSSANDFLPALEQVKQGLLKKARLLRRQAERQDNGVREYERRAAVDANEEDRAGNAAQIATRSKARDTLLAQARDLEERAVAPDGAEELDDKTPSLLIKAANGWIKLVKVESNRAEGIVLAPLTGRLENSGAWQLLITELPESARKVSDRQIVWIEQLRDQGAIHSVFNSRFFTASDSREPELAGIWGAAVGSFWTMLVTFALAFPVGVFGAIYLEEFAPKNRFTRFVEVNINNLAAVPSIVFGLLGLALFLGVFGVPRSAPLAGGIVLALMTLPTIIIAARAAICAVPPSIREAALGVGASRLQTSFHHVLPLAMPGILTGTIIGMAQALGETAPLIMIGMVAFIVDVPHGITDSATVLPVQVFRWSDFPERAFEARTAAAILVLLGFLVLMNGVAIILRKRFERRW